MTSDEFFFKLKNFLAEELKVDPESIQTLDNVLDLIREQFWPSSALMSYREFTYFKRKLKNAEGDDGKRARIIATFMDRLKELKRLS